MSDFATPWTVAHHDPQSMGFSRQEYWRGLPFPSPGDLPNPGIKPGSPALEADALLSEPSEKCKKAKTPGFMLRTLLQRTNLLSKPNKIQVKALGSFLALKTQFLGSVRSVSNHMLLGIMQNGTCLKAYTQKFIVVSQILSYSFIPHINSQS